MIKLIARCVHCEHKQQISITGSHNIDTILKSLQCKQCKALLSSAILFTPKESKKSKTRIFMISLPFKGKDKQWYFNIKGLNHEIILASEGYTRKRDADRLRKVLTNCIMVLDQ